MGTAHSQHWEDLIGAMSEAELIGEAVKKASLPGAVLEVSHRLGEDATGTRAVWLWVVVDDAAASNRNFPMLAAEIRDTIREALQHAGVDRWPYVRFRTRSEEAELAGDATK